MQKINYFLRETFNNLWQYRVRNIFSVTIICLSFLVFGTFLSLSNNIYLTARELSKNMYAVFFLAKNLSQKQVTHIEGKLRESQLAKSVRFVSSEEALKRFEQNFPELQGIVKNIDANPFPPSFEVNLDESSLTSERVAAFIEDMRDLGGVEDVQYNKDWIEKLQSLSRLVKAIGFFLGGILILASFFIISNVIKLNVFTRQEEIGILRLVGASNAFIRIPFLLEGMILGMLGALASLVLLFVLIEFFPLYLGTSLGVLNELITFGYLTPLQMLMIIAGGAMIGLFGSFSSLARFLNI